VRIVRIDLRREIVLRTNAHGVRQSEPASAKVLEEALAERPRPSSSSPAERTSPASSRGTSTRGRGSHTHALGDASRDFNLERLRAKKPPPSWSSRAPRRPMMAKRRVVSVTDVDRCEAPTRRNSSLISATSGNDGALLSAIKIDRRTALRQGSRRPKEKAARAPAIWRFRKLNLPS